MNFEIKKRNIFCCGENVIGDNSDYIANFIFDSEWDYKIKTARFQRTNGKYVDVILENDSCKIPVEVLKFGYLSVGVFTDEMTTTYCDIFVKASIKEKNGNPIEPTSDVYAQIIGMIEKMETSGGANASVKDDVLVFTSGATIDGETLTI